MATNLYLACNALEKDVASTDTVEKRVYSFRFQQFGKMHMKFVHVLHIIECIKKYAIERPNSFDNILPPTLDQQTVSRRA